ncbi:MAG: isochorismatase family protein [Acetobacteraceae bacterium]|nr:isochorismatase family protein [Acetobacteraceae bacterium]
MRMSWMLLAGLAYAGPACAQGVLDSWASVTPPAEKPAVHAVSLAPPTTALLVLDLATQTCSAPSRPRCPAMAAHVQKLIAHAREKHWFVVYALGAASTEADILPAVAKQASEPVITGAPDKFVGTGLEQLLKDHKIKTVVALGSAAEGAVLETVASAAFRGFDVVVPVDGMVSSTLYNEQYVAWDLTHAPRLPERVTLSAVGQID